jgi:hypothetical protein
LVQFRVAEENIKTFVKTEWPKEETRLSLRSVTLSTRHAEANLHGP